MCSTLLFSILIVLSVSQYPTFDEYIPMFNRTYTAGSQEYNLRKPIYEERINNFLQIT